MRRLALPLLALYCLLALACRKDDPAPQTAAPVPPPAPEIAKAVRKAGPVLFVGLDGADWELLDGYMAAGVMPNLAALVREGRPGVLSTIHPPLSPLVWTTMMTGTSPLEHGILDFTRRNPETGAVEPITSGERLVPAIWNMAADGGKSVAVFGLWATWPAEPVRGLLVADRFFTSPGAEPSAGAVFPPEQEAWAREALGKTEEAVGYEALHEYLPSLTEEEYEKSIAEPDPYHPVSALRRILVETRAHHGLATSWLAKERPSLAVVSIRGTDIQDIAKPEDFERFSGVPQRYFAEVDRMLGDYRKLAEASGAVLMIASGHGFSSATAAAGGKGKRDDGIYLLWGPGIEASPQRDRGEVAQVCSTLLALLGLPPGQGVAGPPLPGVEVTRDTLADYRASYRTVPVPPDTTRTAGSYDNEGLLHREKGEVDEAAASFQKALELAPGNASSLWNLSDLLHSAQKDLDRSDDLLLQALEGGLPEGIDFTVGRTVAYARAGETARGLRLLDRALTAKPKEPRLLLLRGRYRLQRHQCERALGDFEGASRSDPRNAFAYASVGLARLCIGDGEGAAQAFRRSLEIDPKQPEIRRALGQIGGG